MRAVPASWATDRYAPGSDVYLAVVHVMGSNFKDRAFVVAAHFSPKDERMGWGPSAVTCVFDDASRYRRVNRIYWRDGTWTRRAAEFYAENGRHEACGEAEDHHTIEPQLMWIRHRVWGLHKLQAYVTGHVSIGATGKIVVRADRDSGGPLTHVLGADGVAVSHQVILPAVYELPDREAATLFFGNAPWYLFANGKGMQKYQDPYEYLMLVITD